MAKIIGIDLGTSNSAAAVMEGGKSDHYTFSRRHNAWRKGIPFSRSVHKRRTALDRRAGAQAGCNEHRRHHHGVQEKDGD